MNDTTQATKPFEVTWKRSDGSIVGILNRHAHGINDLVATVGSIPGICRDTFEVKRKK